MQIKKDACIKRLQDPMSEQKFVPNKNIQFGYHNATGTQIRLTNNGLGAERMNPKDQCENGVAYSARSLKGRAEFEVRIMSYTAQWTLPLQFGVMRCRKGVAIKSGPNIPSDSHRATNHCIWFQERLHNNLVTHNSDEPYLPVYGNVNLDDLREGDCVGLCLSQGGVLEFTVNGESQGVVAKNIYTRNTDVYAVVDHYGSCVATVVTKAGELFTLTCCAIINAWLICLFSTSTPQFRIVIGSKYAVMPLL